MWLTAEAVELRRSLGSNEKQSYQQQSDDFTPNAICGTASTLGEISLGRAQQLTKFDPLAGQVHPRPLRRSNSTVA